MEVATAIARVLDLAERGMHHTHRAIGRAQPDEVKGDGARPLFRASYLESALSEKGCRLDVIPSCRVRKPRRDPIAMGPEPDVPDVALRAWGGDPFAGVIRLGRYRRLGMAEPLIVERRTYLALVAHCYDGLPLEACGLLAAEPATGRVTHCYLTENEAASARVYTVPSRALLGADREAERQGLVLAGVFHSHTHTSAYPSPTDVAQAPDPSWHYVIVGLGEGVPVVRSYRIVDGTVEEEPVALD